MRELRYYLELSESAHRDQAPISFAVAEGLLRGMDWKLPPPDAESEGEPSAPFMLFLDEGESFFMIMPEDSGLRITARVLDKWNLLGLVTKDKTFTLNFGVLDIEESLKLLKLFYEDKYPSLRTLEKKYFS
jgi:hypothetical protein